MSAKRHLTIQDVPLERTESGRPCCRWCKKEIAAGSSRRRWCSQACVDEYLVRSSAGVARSRVFRRDRGVCAKCGLNTGRLERIMRTLRQRARAFDWSPNPWTDEALHRSRWERAKELAAERYRWREWLHLWEADHIVPVAEGGGACGLDNLRTLCRKCHGQESGALRKRLNAAKKSQRPLPDVTQ